jgi:hypothetical protein
LVSAIGLPVGPVAEYPGKLKASTIGIGQPWIVDIGAKESTTLPPPDATVSCMVSAAALVAWRIVNLRRSRRHPALG